MVWRMVWKDPAPARRAVSTALRTAVSYSDDVARQMSQAGLMQRSMPLLRAISVGRPNARLMPVHGFAHDLGRAGDVGHMDDGALAGKHPMVGIDAFDAYARLVAGDKGSLAQNRERLPFLLFEGARRASEHIHQSALADRQAEQIEECLLQPLIGQSLTSFQIDRQRVDTRAERRSHCDSR